MILYVDKPPLYFLCSFLFGYIFTGLFDGFISMKFLIAVFLPASTFVPTIPFINFEIFANLPFYCILPVYYFDQNLPVTLFIPSSPSIWNSREYTSGYNLKEVKEVLLNDLNKVTEWFFENYMVQNTGKCHFMCLGKNTENETFKIVSWITVKTKNTRFYCRQYTDI